METLRITAIRHSAFYSPLLVTIAGGFLRAQGLNADYRPAKPGESVNQLLVSGQFDLAQSAVAASFTDLNKGVDTGLRHFVQINQRDGFFISRRGHEGAFNWQDLVGEEVLVDHLFQPLATLRYGLNTVGVSMDDIKVIDAGSVEMMERAFRSGAGLFIHQQGPAPQQLERDGVATVVAAVGDLIGSVAFSSLCAHRDWLATEQARQFMIAYRQGRQMVSEEKPRVIAKMISTFLPDTDMDVLESTVSSYQALGCWDGDVAISERAYLKLLDVFEYSDLIERRFAYEECVVRPPE
ncbi:MAG: ABC transporter substrate-binding protein [bacterium]